LIASLAQKLLNPTNIRIDGFPAIFIFSLSQFRQTSIPFIEMAPISTAQTAPQHSEERHSAE
jgi:hypothetical protein